jgi:Bardet-Biedl syndrome 4 protein
VLYKRAQLTSPCRAAENFVKANSIEQHDSTFLQLGKVYALQADYQAAVKVCLEALLFCPDNAEVLTTIGLLYLRMGESLKAFDFLGNSLSNDPRNVKSILAAASVIQASCALHSVLQGLHVHLLYRASDAD